MIQVAAAIIKNKENKILICQRKENSSLCALMWEFPGGKLESGETLKECLIRECKEELDISISVKDLFIETTHVYSDREFKFTFFLSEIVQGNIKNNVHKTTKWVSPSELNKYTFCPADVPVVDKLKFI
jgi:8-oxo-dGTP diphosphatase